MEEKSSYRRKMPHLRSSGSIYFVTWRKSVFQNDFSDDERAIVARALGHFHGDRYQLLSFVVMNDHVHAVVLPATRSLEQIVQGWKSFTAHELTRLGRERPIWQHEYFDRVVRDEEELRSTIVYIQNNPRKRWPNIASYPWVAP